MVVIVLGVYLFAGGKKPTQRVAEVARVYRGAL